MFLQFSFETVIVTHTHTEVTGIVALNWYKPDDVDCIKFDTFLLESKDTSVNSQVICNVCSYLCPIKVTSTSLVSLKDNKIIFVNNDT